jgi:hypothetical protein
MSSSLHGTSVLHPVSVVPISETTESGSTVPPENINVRGNSSVASNETPISNHGISSVASNQTPPSMSSVGDNSVAGRGRGRRGRGSRGRGSRGSNTSDSTKISSEDVDRLMAELDRRREESIQLIDGHFG